jgi:hypothetical protein
MMTTTMATKAETETETVDDPFTDICKFLYAYLKSHIDTAGRINHQTIIDAGGGESASNGIRAKKYFETFNRDHQLSILNALWSLVTQLEKVHYAEDPFFKADAMLLTLANAFHACPGYNPQWDVMAKNLCREQAN